jgi:hypothetical protein
MSSFLSTLVSKLEDAPLPSRLVFDLKPIEVLQHIDLGDQFAFVLLAIFLWVFRPPPSPPKGWFVQAWNPPKQLVLLEKSRNITERLEKAVSAESTYAK